MKRLNSRVSVAEFERILQKNGILRKEYIFVRDYAKDHHFAHYCYGDINSLEDALAFCDELDATEEYGKCSKAREIRVI